MYDPRVGVWLNLDPIGFKAGDSNPNRYVGNSPTNASDPTGLKSEPQNREQAEAEVAQMIKRHPGLGTRSFVALNTIPNPNSSYAPHIISTSDGDIKRLSTANGVNNVAVLEIIGHARITVGVEGISLGKTCFLSRSNVGLFISDLRAVFPSDPRTGRLDGLLILTACCLGCYTKSDKATNSLSLVQYIANQTGLRILSPGGFASGSFLHPSGPMGDIGTEAKLYESLQDSRGKTLWQKRPEVKPRAYDSKDGIWYLTLPD